MKIYTKTGDSGTTSLFGGSRVPKYHMRIESYGTIDELNSHIGLLAAYSIPKTAAAELKEIQETLFTIGAELASEPEKKSPSIPIITLEHSTALERQIDLMEEQLEPLRNFILPGGHIAVAQAHVCRCVCRRAERMALALKAESEVSDTVLIYLNRLSDYLFVLSRFIGHKLGAPEIAWTPNKI